MVSYPFKHIIYIVNKVVNRGGPQTNYVGLLFLNAYMDTTFDVIVFVQLWQP
jgi:hypothetical protein